MPVQTSDLSEFGWNERLGRYIDSSGKMVSFSAVRDELEHVIDAASDRMAALSLSLQQGNISLAEWQSGMMENIKIAHVASTASANGGWAQMSQSDWGFTGSLIKPQYQYLQNFVEQIADGSQALDGRLLVRTDMYGDAARGSFEEMRRRYEKLSNGMEEGRRVLGESDHCEDCLDYASEGWMPIDDVPAIGDSVCKVNCHCTIEYRRSGDVTSEEE